MTSPYLAADIQADEGYAKELDDGSCHAYPDPLSGAEPWTIGFGSTGPDIDQDTVWTRQQAEDRCNQKIEEIEAELDLHIPWWRSICDYRQDVVVNMSYNLGVAGLLAFHNTLSAIQVHSYGTAADQMLASKWAKQVPNRAQRLAQQMRTGERVPR